MKKNIEPFSKEWWKQYNKLSIEDRQKVLELLVEETMKKALIKATINAMIDGIRFASESLYETYVQPLDKLNSNSEEWSTLVTKLLSNIRVSHFEYEKLKVEREKLVGIKSEEVGNE